ncbi:synaptotagmin-like protein 2 isoform X2 [Phyllopteryx taeniolatus]|uniref:synaptotagmin-like protein 2 isoform X2 n=1 Tax=Phyllopteryx taeniolatus TaxID=161469 RepID=UPI002AD4CBDD|nr:synaptotagmin-like protein 2 isoform X2 [Phyllopteryx taeniolatus]
MIDLSFLTEEERGVIMTVLTRDAQLKQAEEQRIRKLESILSQGSSSDSKLKYLTGQWFYEAKSRRHMDRIHGSEIILASMKQRRASEGSFRAERPKAPGTPRSGVETPQKPARCLDMPQEPNNAKNEDHTSAVHSPRMARRNPFNRASLIVVEPTEEDSETEPISPLKYQQPGGSSQTSGTSVTSEGSSAGFRPIPKKRSFVLRRTPILSDSNGVDLDPQPVLAGVAPAPRQTLNQGSSGSSNRSKSEAAVLAHHSASSEIPQQLLYDDSQVLPHSSLEGHRKKSSIIADRETAQMTEDNPTLGEHLNAGRILDHDPVISGSVMSSVKEPEWQRTAGADPPISYDINFIESSDQKTQKRSQQKHSLKLTNQSSSPTGNDEDSIAKVLEWFNRSTDSSDWLNRKDGPKVSRNTERHHEPDAQESEEILKKEVGSIQEKESVEIMIGQSEGTAREVARDVKNDYHDSNNIAQMKSFWENSNKYPKTITSMVSGDKAETREGNDKTPNVHSGVFNGKINNVANGADGSQHVELKHDRELDSFYLGNYAYPDSLTVHPQVAERKGSDVELLFVEQLAPKSPLQTSLEFKGLSLVQPDTLYQSTDPPSPESENISFSQSIQFADLKTCGNNVENICKTPRSSSEDHAQSPKRNSPNSPHSQRQNHPRHENTAEKIKQLKSFWEQETSKPLYDGGKPKAMRRTKLNKRLTKSEFDLRTIGNNSGSDGEDRNDLTGLPLNQRIDKMSPTLGGSRAQFNSLLEFWGDATTDCKLKSPKRQFNTPQPPQELRYSEPESRLSSVEMSHDRQIVSALKAANKNNLPELGPPKEPKKILKDSSREDRVTRPPPTPPKEVCCPRRRKDSFSHSSSRSRSLRRATSMFVLVDPEEPRLKSLVSPVHSQSRKQSVDRSQNIGRASDGTETLLARAFVPRDYSHYLGMANEPSTLAPDEEASEGLSRPVRTSIPTDSEERGFKRSTKISPCHVWTNCNSTDVDPQSPVGSTSESWFNTRNPLLLNCKSDDDEDNPVRKALRRAEVRPKGLAKSMEDLAGSLSSRQEKGQELKTNLRRTIDDQDHLKKMSKSVPLVLQREDDSHIYEDIFQHGIYMMDSSSNLASVSPLRGSAMTMYNGDFGGVEVQGSIQFSINYVQKLREFHIFVAQCRDLAAVDPKRGRSDPYVKSYLVPDKIHLGKKKTSVKKKTLNPTFNEILRYRVSIGYLRTQTLVLSVWHHDTFGRNNFLGEADVDLSNWNFDHTHMNDFALKPRSTATLAPSSGQGEMRLAIRFLPKVVHSEAKEAPTTGEIHIWVKECKSLPLIRATIDPYVKCFMLPDTSRKSRQKTRMLRRTAEPVFNHTMVYDGIREVDLAEACVELTVWDRDKLASSQLGGLRLGAGTGTALEHDIAVHYALVFRQSFKLLSCRWRRHRLVRKHFFERTHDVTSSLILHKELDSNVPHMNTQADNIVE